MRKIKTILIIFIFIGIYPAIIEAENSHSYLPPYFSWRDVNGIDYTTPIKNQAPAPTCEAYALVAALETKMQYKLGKIYNPDLSEAHLFFYPGGSIKAGYVNIIDAANYLIEYGVPDEGCFPDPHRPYDFPFESLPGWENRTVKITEWGWVEHTPEAMKKALIEHGPLIVCMYFWRDFYYYRGGIYRHKWGRLAGGHVMAIVGYDDEQRCWIIKNSWGTGWGEDGWLRIDYDALKIAEWYGEGTGVMYIEGIYGNLMPDVPKIEIEQPEIYHTYIFGREFPTLLRRIPFI
jgi:C1A family cysteine protease